MDKYVDALLTKYARTNPWFIESFKKDHGSGIKYINYVENISQRKLKASSFDRSSNARILSAANGRWCWITTSHHSRRPMLSF